MERTVLLTVTDNAARQSFADAGNSRQQRRRCRVDVDAYGVHTILDHRIDASGVHPEAYPVVRRILAATKRQLERLIGDTSVLCQLEPEAFTDTVFGVPTVTDILRELEKPGRDPRPAFKTASFREGVEKLEDLEPGMVLEGVVTNVAAFGAFVDVGVHQDGLVHISAMANAYVRDPRKGRARVRRARRKPRPDHR